MGFFWKSKPKRENKSVLSNDKRSFSSKIFSSSKKIAKRDRREITGANREEKGYSGFGVLFLWLLFGGTVVYVLFFSFFLSIANTSVSGMQKISSENVERLVANELSGKRFKIWPRNNFFSVRPQQIEELLQKEYPLLKKVVVTRIFPNSLRVDIEERDKIVVWCSNGVCSLLDEAGILAENAHLMNEENAEYRVVVSDMSNQLVTPGQKISEDGKLWAFIISVEPALKEHLGIEAGREYETTSRFADELRVKTGEGWELYLNTIIPIDTSLEDLKLLFDKELPPEKRTQLRYIDLRVENRVYYVLQNGEEVTATDSVSADSEKKTDETKVTEKEKKKKK